MKSELKYESDHVTSFDIKKSCKTQVAAFKPAQVKKK